MLCTVLLTITLVVGALAVLRNPQRFEMNSSSSESSSGEPVSVPSDGESSQPPAPEGDAPEGDTPAGGEGEGAEEAPVFFNRPSQLRGMYLTPGVDFLTSAATTSDAIKAEVDKAMGQVKNLSMNSVIIHLNRDGKAIWLQSDLPTVETDFDVLTYAIEQARAAGYYVYVVFDVFSEENPVPIDAALMETVNARCQTLAQGYDVDGILLDTYYNPTTENSYAQYRQNGGGVSFDSYQRLLPKSTFTQLADNLHSQARNVQVGMMTEAVWANEAQEESGSVTNAAYTTLHTGNVDNRSFVEEGYVDFIAVKAYSATTDKNVPFKSVVNWWGNLASENEVPFYVVHAADKACTQEAGWTEYDQLTRQLIELDKTPGYSGSAFNSLTRMLEDPENSATTVVKFFNNEVNSKHILTELAVTEPKQTTYTTFEQNVTFKGASDPNVEITINGTRISTDQNGYFSVNLELKPGANKFTIVHKGKTLVFNITRQVQVLKEISPTGNITLDGGMKVTITATAYKDAKVYAVVGGKTITLSKVETEGDNSDKDTSYVRFEGIYTAPAAGTAVQDIGNITVYGESLGFKEQKQGAFIRVNKKAVIGDGTPVQVVADQAETFPISVINDYSDASYYPLPKGTVDYAIGDEIIYKDGDKTFSYYILASNLRVYSKDIKAVSDSYAVDNNSINGMTVTANSRYTDVIFHTQQQVSYAARYDGGSFTVAFNYTSGHPDDMSLSENPLFSSASWSGSTVSLRLSKQNRLLGYRAFYDDEGNLVLRFNNPPPVSGGDLSGVRIVVDPGHGGPDPGASGFLPAYPESIINRMIAELVTEELRGRGASVTMLESDVTPKMTLETRVALTRNADPHLFISIHCNSSKTNFSATGSEVYFFNQYSQSFANYASAAISSAIGTGNRGGKFGYYYVTRDTQYPGVLCETGFLSNEREYKKLISTDYQAEIATGIADAVGQYFHSLGGSGATGTESSGQSTSQVRVEDVSVDERLSLAVGEAQTLEAEVSPRSANNRSVTYHSSDTAVVTVDGNGNAFGVKAGSATITVRTDDGGYEAQCAVTVTGEGQAVQNSSSGSTGSAPAEKIILSENELELNVGEKVKLTATVLPEGEASQKVNWESDNTGVAKVSADGTVTAVSGGEALITAVSADGEVYDDCLVYVAG